MKRNIVYLKIGNSQIRLLEPSLSFSSDAKGLRGLRTFLARRKNTEIHFISVVPAISKKLKQAYPRAKEWTARNIPLKFAYQKGLGADRAFNLFAASQIFPDEKLVVIDLGTATTVDFFDSQKHLGGWIVPGIQMLGDVLAEKTALLPKLKGISKGAIKPGASTILSMQRGRQALVEGLIRVAEELAYQKLFKTRNFRLVFTGGHSKRLRYRSTHARQNSKVLLLQLLGIKYLSHASSRL